MFVTESIRSSKDIFGALNKMKVRSLTCHSDPHFVIHMDAVIGEAIRIIVHDILSKVWYSHVHINISLRSNIPNG